MKKFFYLIVLLSIFSCKKNVTEMRQDFQSFISYYDSIVIPLTRETGLAEWNANISGKEEDYSRFAELQTKFSLFHSNKETFKRIENIKASKAITDPIQARQLEIIYLTYLNYQADTSIQKEIIQIQNQIEQKYSTFRAEIDGKLYTDNDIEDILRTSTDNVLLQKAWEAHKKIGELVEKDIIELVKKRNKLARQLGFANYHEMKLKLNDQEPKEIEIIFDQLDSMTTDAFKQVKEEIDTYLAKRYKVDKSMLMPWNYQNRFFQEAPNIYPTDIDKYYYNQNLVSLTSQFYKSIDMPVDDIIERSDLYEKPGKNQHAFCTNIDREDDIRVLCNIKPNSYWMNTMLHEFGHATYEKYIDRQLPFVLRQPSHTFTTEAIAILFGRLSSNPYWIMHSCNISKKEADKIAENCFKTLRIEELVFSRWSQVMYRFEKALYNNPDQDLNQLWWTLVEKYQLLKKPSGRNKPDWASKIHIATVPCYYHNYLLGDILASQLHYYICSKVINDTSNIKYFDYYERKEVGKFLKEKFYAPGTSLYWNDLIEQTTGEKLTAKYYANQFINK